MDTGLNIEQIECLEIDGVDPKDYPDFCDAFICHGVWKDSGKELTDEELEALTDEYPEIVNEMAFEACVME